MSNPSTPDFFAAAAAVYGEDEVGYAETTANLPFTTPAIPSKSSLLSDLTIFLQQQGVASWQPIDVQYIPADGFYAAAFLTGSGQIIISYEGTVPGKDSTFERSTVSDDLQIFAKEAPNALTDALNFAISISAEAPAYGIEESNIFVTGHSLGGVEAEYASWKTGLGGVTFGATGVPGYTETSNSSLVDYVDYGDPIGNYASNMPFLTGEKGFAPILGMDHVGTVMLEGTPSNAITLANNIGYTSKSFFLESVDKYHLLQDYAIDLGVGPGVPTLSPPYITALSPEDVLVSLDSSLGTPGQQDLSAAMLTNDDGGVISPNFTVNIVYSSNMIVITQNQIVSNDSGQLDSDPGVETVIFDPVNLNVILDSFADSVTGNIIQFLPNLAPQDDAQNISFGNAGDAVVIDNVGSYVGTISNFIAGDTIDLAGIGTATEITLGAGNVLTVQGGGVDVVLNLNPTQNFSNSRFVVEGDGDGGSMVTLIQPAVAEVIFSGADANGVVGLWVTNGLASDTTELTTESGGISGSIPGNILNLGEETLFSSGPSVPGDPILPGLWETDGTVEGTERLSTAVPVTSYLHATFVILGSQAIYDAIDSNGHNELWVTNGTVAGTQELTNVYGGSTQFPYSVTPSNIVVTGAKAYFNGYDANDISELWVTDGTVAGTEMLTTSTAGSTYNTTVALANGVLFKGASSNSLFPLWFSNGTPSGTINLVFPTKQAFPEYPSDIVSLNGKALFAAVDPTQHNSNFVYYTQLWETDGTVAGTQELSTGAYSGVGLSPSSITSIGSIAIFWGAPPTGSSGNGLWVTDGTTLNLLGSFILPTSSTFSIVGNRAFFNATQQTGSTAYELWTTDGTAGGTRELTSRSGSALAAFGAKTLFSETDQNGKGQLWVTDGTANGTIQLTSGAAGLTANDFTVIGNKALFVGADNYGNVALFVTDGTVAGTFQLPGFVGVYTSDLTAVGNQALFEAAGSDGSGYQLWITDGTVAGTHAITNVVDQNTGSSLSPNNITALSGVATLACYCAGTLIMTLWGRSLPFTVLLGLISLKSAQKSNCGLFHMQHLALALFALSLQQQASYRV